MVKNRFRNVFEITEPKSGETISAKDYPLHRQIEAHLLSEGVLDLAAFAEEVGHQVDVVRTALARCLNSTDLTTMRQDRKNAHAIHFLEKEGREGPGLALIRPRVITGMTGVDFGCPSTVTQRTAAFLGMDIVERGSNTRHVISEMQDGQWHTSTAMASAIGKQFLNMPVTLRKVREKLPMFGLDVEGRVSSRHTGNRPPREYRLVGLDIPEEVARMPLLDELERLSRIEFNRLVNCARPIVRIEEEAIDLVQGRIAAIYEKIAKGDLGNLPISGLQPYLYTAVKRRAINVYRNTKRRKERLARSDEDLGVIPGMSAGSRGIGVSPEHRAQQAELSDEIEKYLSALTKDHREVLLLRHLQGLSIEETANALDLHPGTVATRTRRALINLKKVMSNNSLEK